jgi:fatty acid desaturase
LLLAGWAWSWPVLFLPASGCSFVFFLTGLRVVHNAHHYALGLPRWATEWVMVVMSVLMLGSMHSVQRNHLQHHKHCMDDDDLKGYSARLSAWRALLYGPFSLVRLHVRGFRLGRRRHRRWILAELAAGALWVFFVFALSGGFALSYHLGAMAVGQCMTSFFTV